MNKQNNRNYNKDRKDYKNYKGKKNRKKPDRFFKQEYPINKILRQIDQVNLLPAIVFRSSRRQCDVDLKEVHNKSYTKLTSEEQAHLKERVQTILEDNQWSVEIFDKHPQYKTLVEYGIGAHHAGQLLQWRLLLEDLMSAGLLRLMIATGTVAAGVDFPARTVIVTSHGKRGHEGFKDLTPSEFQQMSGRAGRRGKDRVGFCLLAPTADCDARVIHSISKRPPEPLKSAYFASPSSILNLLKYRSIEDLTYMVENSLAGFADYQNSIRINQQADRLEKEYDEVKDELNQRDARVKSKKISRLRRQANELELYQKNTLENSLIILQDLKYLDEQTRKLSEKGLWAAELCTNLVLELAEIINDFLFDQLSPKELCLAVASISGDSYRKYLNIKKPGLSKRFFEEIKQRVQVINQATQDIRITEDTPVLLNAAYTVEAWIDAPDWIDYTGLLKFCGVSDGDATRLITQTADQLQQIMRLQESHPDLANTAEEARKLLFKAPLSDML